VRQGGGVGRAPTAPNRSAAAWVRSCASSGHGRQPKARPTRTRGAFFSRQAKKKTRGGTAAGCAAAALPSSARAGTRAYPGRVGLEVDVAGAYMPQGSVKSRAAPISFSSGPHHRIRSDLGTPAAADREPGVGANSVRGGGEDNSGRLVKRVARAVAVTSAARVPLYDGDPGRIASKSPECWVGVGGGGTQACSVFRSSASRSRRHGRGDDLDEEGGQRSSPPRSRGPDDGASSFSSLEAVSLVTGLKINAEITVRQGTGRIRQPCISLDWG